MKNKKWKWSLDKMISSDKRFIWGVLANDDSTGGVAGMYTLNDIDIVYDRRKETYKLSIETIYTFTCIEYEREYLRGLLNKFTEWMKTEELNTKYELRLHEFFACDSWERDSIAELYAFFKLLVTNFE